LCTRALLLPHDDVSWNAWRARNWRQRLVLLGGGTLINADSFLWPLRRCFDLGAAFAVFGTGVCDIGYWSAHAGWGRGHEAEWLRLLPAARYLGVRGPRSADWLRSHGVRDAEVVGDPALSLLLPCIERRVDGPLRIGLNLGSHDPVEGGQDRTTRAARALVRCLVARGHVVRFVPMSDVDHAIGAALAAAVDPRAFELRPVSADVDAAMHDIAGCDLMVGQRLHATVLACAVNVPVLSLSYQPKCLDFLESIEAADLAVPTATIDGRRLVERVDALLAEAGAVRARIARRVGDLRTLQRCRAEALGWA
jgi:polysaccharide pyruvyl transferase WcaK-like protein